MSDHGLFHVSLAAKCRLLFGLAVALIIGAALFVPWWVLEQLVHDRNVQQARSMALLAHAAGVDPRSTDWFRQQSLLNQWWRVNSEPLKLSCGPPQLILVSPTALASAAQLQAAAQLRRPIKWARRLAPFMSSIEPLEVGALAWYAIPKEAREKALTNAEDVVTQLARVIDAPYPKLDASQQEAVRKMTTDEKVSGLSFTEKNPGEPTTYRYILAIRGQEAGAVGRPLVGIVDVKLPKPKDQALWVIRLVVVLAGVLAGFLAILVFYLITQKLILAPVRELRGLAEQITQGDLSARAQIETGDEYEELGTAFNDMLGQLERSRIELESINRSLDTRLGELAETNVTLYESNRLKSEFLANVSHELRTPLTSIIGFADLLRDGLGADGPIDTARAARYANNILTSGRMLLEIINDLLDLAKIEAGRIELHRTVFSLRDLCEALADFMRPLADKKQQTLEMELYEPLPMMNSDAGKLRQILYNLLSNAVKYTPEGGHIRFTAEPLREGDRVRLAVLDNGPGIAREDQQRIFEKFRQLDSSVTREHSGTGLGLAISRELAVMLGGSIRVESEPGHGAAFTVELPVECSETSYRSLPSLT